MRRIANLFVFLIFMTTLNLATCLESQPNYYTVSASINDKMTYQVKRADYSSVQNITEDILNEELLNELINLFNIFNFFDEINSSTRIKYSLSKINDSFITFYKDFSYVFPNVTKSWGSYPEYQNLSLLLLTNRIMTDNMTLITDYVDENSANLIDYVVSADYQWFLKREIVENTNYTINVSFSEGWMTHLYFKVTNETCDLPIIEFEMIEYVSASFPPNDPSYMRFPVEDPYDFMINLKEDDYLILEVKEFVDKERSISIEQYLGSTINLNVEAILSPGIIISNSLTYPNGTTTDAVNYTDNFQYLIVPTFYITLNTTLINLMVDSNPYWGYDIGVSNISFISSAENYPDTGIKQTIKCEYDINSGWLIFLNVTKVNMTTGEIVQKIVEEAIDFSPSPQSTSSVITNSTETTTNESSEAITDKSSTIPTTSPFFLMSTVLVLIAVSIIRKKR